MGYNPRTTSGHNMFVIASLLQKAIRRGDREKAGYAAKELFANYDAVLWKRLLVVSAEDCFGVITKEIEALHKAHIKANEGLKGYQKKCGYASVAVSLLCDSLKSRDACYYSCNFIMSDNKGKSINIDSDKVYDFSKNFFEDQDNLLINECEKEPTARQFFAYLLYHSIPKFDMENSGYAIKMLADIDLDVVWRVLYAADKDFTDGLLGSEIDALVYADNFVNKKKKPSDRDPLFMSKALMNIMYILCRKFKTVLAASDMEFKKVLNPKNIKSVTDIRKCVLENGRIPDYVYDVHTIQGKRAGHTDWEMNIVEQDALTPLMPAFFDNGSWELRYDFKNRVGICSYKEYQESLEYRKNHPSNPSIDFIKKFDRP